MIPEYYVALLIRFLMGIVLGTNLSLISPYIKHITPTQILGKTVKKNKYSIIYFKKTILNLIRDHSKVCLLVLVFWWLYL